MNSISKIAKEFGINYSGTLIGNILGYIWLMIMTRYLTQEDFGSFSLAQSIINISMIFVLMGTHRALDRYIPIFNSLGENGKIRSLIRIIILFSLGSSLIIGLVLYLASDYITFNVFSDPVLSSLLPIVILSIPTLALVMIVDYTFSGYKELRYHVYLKQIIEPGLKILFALVLALAGLSIVQWSWLYVLALGITALAAGLALQKLILRPLAKVAFEKVNIWEIITYSWPISIASIMVIVIGQIDYLLLGVYHPAANVGIYRIYIQIIALLKLILGSIARIYKPIISELVPGKEYAEIHKTYRRISKWILTLTLLGFLILVFYGNQIIQYLFTSSYADYPLVLIILAAGVVLNSLFGPEGKTLEAFGNTKLILFNSLVSLGVNVGIGILLIPDYGIIGAAISTGLTLTIGGMLGFVELKYLYKMQPFSVDTLKIILVGSITGVIFLLAGDWLPSSGIPGLLLEIILLIIFYFAGVLLTRTLDDVDTDLIKSIWLKVIKRSAR